MHSYPEGYELPEGSNVAAYEDRGWCFTESRWAALTKPALASFDLGVLGEASPASRAQLAERQPA